MIQKPRKIEPNTLSTVEYEYTQNVIELLMHFEIRPLHNYDLNFNNIPLEVKSRGINFNIIELDIKYEQETTFRVLSYIEIFLYLSLTTTIQCSGMYCNVCQLILDYIYKVWPDKNEGMS